MEWLEEMSPERRTGGGFLFLLIAIAVLVVQPVSDPFILAVIALANLVISGVFFVTLGREASSDEFDFGTWAASVVAATVAYAAISLGMSGELDMVQFMAFVVAFSVGLAFFSGIRNRFNAGN